MARARTIPLLYVCALALALAPSGAQGEAGTGPEVYAYVPLNTPLTDTLHPFVVSDSAAENVTVTAYLRVGGTSLGRIGSVAVQVTSTRQRVTLPLPAGLRDRAVTTGHRTGHRRASVIFVVASSSGRSAGLESYVSLHAPVRTTGPTAVELGGSVVTAAGGRSFSGTATLATPAGWLRTSARGAPRATFVLPLGGSCVADVVAQPDVVAARSAATVTATRGRTLRAGRRGAVTWRLTVAGDGALPGVRAVGARLIAPRRYVTVRVDLAARPGCETADLGDPALLSTLQRAVSHLRTQVTLRARR